MPRAKTAWRSGAFWRAQTPGARFRLLSGVFLSFAAVGFLGDMASVSAARSPFQMTVNAVYSGLLAVGFAYSGLRGSSWRMAIMVILLMATLPLAPRMVILTGEAGRAAAAVAPTARIRFGAASALISIAAAYAMFMNFIRRDGERHVRLRTEVDLAKALHDRLAPPIEMRGEHYEFLGRALPSSEIAGDLLDVAGAPDRPVVYVADVTGHGIGAGTVAAMVKSAVRMGLLSRSRPEAVLGDQNRVLVQLDRPGLFVTCAAVALDPGGPARVALAGHLPVLLVPAGGGPGGTVRRIPNQAPPLGVVADARITPEEVACGPGDLFALVTDGLTEVIDGHGQEFGLERVERVLVESASRPLAEIADRVFAAARAHGRQQDDQTLLLVRVLSRLSTA
jgi:serine phosphatase RsbU (regulator of sigma subunit)